MDKAAICNRLARIGLREAADAYRDEVRKRRKASGEERDAANEGSWEDMAALFLPAAERIESGSSQTLSGCAEDPDQYIDPDYHETDPGKWIRDGLLWTAAEIRRVVIDSPEGASIDLRRAKTKPPTVWAIFCLEGFGRKPPAQRVDLIAKVLPFATKAHDPRDVAGNSSGFMGEIDAADGV